MLEDRINKDLKAALLAGDKRLVMTLRGLKSSLLYAKIASQSRDQAMPDESVVAVFQKEAKKRQESAELYKKGGNAERAEAELREKTVIEAYLPKQLSEREVAQKVDEAIVELGQEQTQMGPIIAKVKQMTAGAADGAIIAHVVRERLGQ